MKNDNAEMITQEEIEIPYDDDALVKMKELLLFRRIVQVSDNTLELDNGVILEIHPNQGSCPGCCSGDYEIIALAGCDNAITNVELVCAEIDDVDSSYDQSYRIDVYAEDERIRVLQVDGTDGNGYYGTGYTIFVKRLKKRVRLF